VHLPDDPCSGTEAFNLDDMLVGELEYMLTHMLIVKYPGIEQQDVTQLLLAIDAGDLEQIERLEADMAQKSARWMLAVLNIDRRRGGGQASGG